MPTHYRARLSRMDADSLATLYERIRDRRLNNGDRLSRRADRRMARIQEFVFRAYRRAAR